MSNEPVGLETPIDDITFTVLDTETTGTNPGEGHEIIEIGMAHYSGRQVTDTFETLIQPCRFPTKEAASIHKISTEELKKAPLLEETVDGILCFIGDSVIAAHNVSFDMTFIHTSLRRLGRPILHNWAIDTILLSQRTWPDLTCHCLICLGTALNLPHKGTHRALEDVYATTELLDRIIDEMLKKGKRTLADLHPLKRDYAWGEGDVYQELLRNLRCAIRRNELIHIHLYDKKDCIYFQQTVEPIELLDSGNLRARVLGEESEKEFPLHNIIKISPTYKE